MSSELSTNVKPPFRVGAVKTGLAARRAAANPNTPIEVNPAELEHRIGIVFDDSGSMCGDKIIDARAGVEEFLRSCEPNKTSVAVYPMCSEHFPLTANLPALAILTSKIQALGGSTPLLRTLTKMRSDNNLTRMIVFSDGSPNDADLTNYTKEFGIVDTVFIGDGGYYNGEAAKFMSDLAAKTGGIFLEFKAGQSNFRTAFKYLSPGLRYMLADRSFVDKLEGK
jgi:hypothetical protein